VTSLSRRQFFTKRVLPVAGVGLGVAGAKAGAESAQLVEIEMTYPDLPPALEGLRILQYSDVHLGHIIDIDEISALVARGHDAKADLVVLTGDIADDIGQLPRALAMFSELAPRLGVFAAIGNHEYYRGIMATRRAYEQSKVPLLLEHGQAIDVDGTTLFLSGADDPRHMGRQTRDFFARTLDTTLDGAPAGAFHVLMSHRPEGFDAGEKLGVQLTLSGHTHGAQMGVSGRSILEPLLPDKYMWGAYQRNGSRLYTSSGAGHWLPLRWGCPRELPVIKLAKGPADRKATKIVFAI